MSLPDLSAFATSRDALHAYCRSLGAVGRALAPPHPRWWHVSLRVVADGLATAALPVPGQPDVRLELRLDLSTGHLRGRCGETTESAALAGLSGKDFRAALDALLERLGADARRPPAAWETEAPLAYDPAAATAFHHALATTRDRFAAFRDALSGERSPVQLWPHHLDLAFEWFGGRKVRYEEEGAMKEADSQIGFGLSPGDAGHPEPYFYTTPWPFEEAFRELKLPAPARWESEHYQGGFLAYEAVRRDDGDLLERFLRASFKAAAPALA